MMTSPPIARKGVGVVFETFMAHADSDPKTLLACSDT